MKKFNRDHVILFIILPMILIGGYLHQFAVPAARECAKLSARKTELGSEKTIRMETAGLERKLKEARKRLEQVKTQADAARTADSPASRLQTLSALCRTCGGEIISFRKSGQEHQYNFGARHWDLAFEASYAGLGDFLDALAKDDASPLVESLSVDVIANGEKKRYIWTLTLSL